MSVQAQGKKQLILLWVTFFFLGMAPGFWIPSLTNILHAKGLGNWVAIAFAINPICALISPLIGGALADEKISAQKLLGYSSICSGVALALAFTSLHIGLSPWWMIGFLALSALASGPSWGLGATISLAHLKDAKRQYPIVRLGATFGWMGAGFFTSYLLQADSSPVAGYGAAAGRFIIAAFAFFLPNTPPRGSGKSWKDALGLGGLALFKNRNHATLLIVTGLFSIPLAAFYMYSPELFSDLGNKTPAFSMSLAQVTEIAAMLLLGSLMVRYRLKTLLMWALGLSALRFALSGYAGFSGVIGWHFTGVMLHGVCYTFYFVTAQVYLDRRVEPEKRAQAQGLLSLMSAGVGQLIGVLFVGWLRAVCVDEDGQGWENFWWILATMISVCWLAFGIFYKKGTVGR